MVLLRKHKGIITHYQWSRDPEGGSQALRRFGAGVCLEPEERGRRSRSGGETEVHVRERD